MPSYVACFKLNGTPSTLSWPTTTARLFPPQPLTADGHAPVTVASRFGTLSLQRQVFAHTHPAGSAPHVMPGNALLPPHHGIIVTRSLQEWACLLPQDLPFAPVARLLGWQTHEQQVLCDTTIRSLVRQHGSLIRQAEQTELDRLLAQDDLTQLTPQLVPAQAPRRRAGWPSELSAAVEAAVQAETPQAPEGVSWADWERVLQARRQEATLSVEELRRLGPQVSPEQVVVMADEVLTRTPVRRHFWELRTACLLTTEGRRYLSGTGGQFVTLLLVMVLLCAGRRRAALVVADGARWIRMWFAAVRTQLPSSELVLDWYHLRKKCHELGSRICRGRKAKQDLMRPVVRHLWRGEVDGALAVLEGYRGQTRNEAVLDELLGYLRERRGCIPNYGQRRCERQYIGSGIVEKVNDVLVAQRQKGAGMHWSLETSDALAALRTLMLNGGWERYWSQGEVLPLVAT